VAAILIGYQLLLGLLALMPQHEQRAEQVAFNHSFLLVIHLQNKEQEISKTLYSLYGLVYPWNLFEVLVIADYGTGNAANVARKFGATVLERESDQYKGRSDVLCWALEQIRLWEEKYDAIVVIEPGGLISGNFLEVMNQHLEEGSNILQSSNLKVLTSGPWRIKFAHTARLIYNHVNSLGRKKLGLDTRLMGNGICFKTKVLKNISMELSQTIDDFDDRMPLHMNGVRTDFAPEAIVWSQFYDSSGERQSHKARDSQFQIVKKNVRHFINRFIDNKSLQDFDTLVSLITPPLKALFMGTTGMVIINWALWRFGNISASFFWIWITLLVMVTIYLLIGIATDRAFFLD